MEKLLNVRSLIFGIPTLMFLSLILLLFLPVFQQNPSSLAWAISLDFILTIPFVYFLLIRKRKDIPKITVVSLSIIGMITASLVIPAEHQSFLSSVKVFILPVLELILLSYLVFQARSIIQEFKIKKDNTLDFFDALNIACAKVLPSRAGKVLATEIALFYYLFFAKKNVCLNENEFSYYKKNGIRTVIGVFIGLVFIETGIVHILVDKWNGTVAWVLTGLGFYTAIQIIALLRSMNMRPIKIDFTHQKIVFKYGFFCQTSVAFQEIKAIELCKKSLPSDNSITQFSPFGMLDNHNIILHLNSKHEIQKIYGLTKAFNSLAIYVDEAEEFVNKIKAIL